ncbi:14104_t:CDS:2 [Funneliformis caledonium]|uniref:14104_t:CDS:1 n=1 Tax=Funneliformis caledonium TaxID=1117310 RepID=A0A9N9AKF8_9GLOM|nr:14104_t:CDS:2 [Funneliformis caledonium]
MSDMSNTRVSYSGRTGKHNSVQLEKAFFYLRRFFQEAKELDPVLADTLKAKIFSALSVPSDGGEIPGTSLLAFWNIMTLPDPYHS